MLASHMCESLACALLAGGPRIVYAKSASQKEKIKPIKATAEAVRVAPHVDRRVQLDPAVPMVHVTAVCADADASCDAVVTVEAVACA